MSRGMSENCNLIGLPRSKTADSAQPRYRSIVTRPFSLLVIVRAGSGHETTCDRLPCLQALRHVWVETGIPQVLSPRFFPRSDDSVYMLEYTHRNEGKTSKTMENSGTALKTLVETSKTMENSGTALKTLVETSKTKENPETAFRTLVVEIGESMNREDLQKLKFIYSVTNEEFAQVKISLDLFELLIERRQLSCDRDQLDSLANKLGSIQKPELKVLVETYITNYLSPSHIVTSSRAIQECGQQLSQVEISR